MKSTTKVRLHSNKRLFGGLLVILLVGLIGSYLVFASQAESIPDNAVLLTDSNSMDYNAHSSYKVDPRSGKIDVFIKVPRPPTSVSQLHFSLFIITHLRATSFDCVSGYTCQFKEGGYTGIESVYDYDASINTSQVNFCVPLKSGDAGRTFGIGTLNFEPGSAVHQDFSKDFRQDFYEVHAFVEGPCPSNLPRDKWYTDTFAETGKHTVDGSVYYSGGGIKADWGERGTVGDCTGTCGGGGDDGDPGNGRGNGGEGEGTDGDGDGQGAGDSGGGSAGSIAQQQANKPNFLPKSSNQGTTKQPKLEPSPFFDGKQYKRGSETDNYTIGTILSSTGSTIAKGLPFALGAVAIAGTGFAVYWRVWRK